MHTQTETMPQRVWAIIKEKGCTTKYLSTSLFFEPNKCVTTLQWLCFSHSWGFKYSHNGPWSDYRQALVVSTELHYHNNTVSEVWYDVTPLTSKQQRHSHFTVVPLLLVLLRFWQSLRVSMLIFRVKWGRLFHIQVLNRCHTPGMVISLLN